MIFERQGPEKGAFIFLLTVLPQLAELEQCLSDNETSQNNSVESEWFDLQTFMTTLWKGETFMNTMVCFSLPLQQVSGDSSEVSIVDVPAVTQQNGE
jgi:hypothetical protein